MELSTQTPAIIWTLKRKPITKKSIFVHIIFWRYWKSFVRLKIKSGYRRDPKLYIEVSEKPLVGRKTPCGLFWRNCIDVQTFSWKKHKAIFKIKWTKKERKAQKKSKFKEFNYFYLNTVSFSGFWFHCCIHDIMQLTII